MGEGVGRLGGKTMSSSRSSCLDDSITFSLLLLLVPLSMSRFKILFKLIDLYLVGVAGRGMKSLKPDISSSSSCVHGEMFILSMGC